MTTAKDRANHIKYMWYHGHKGEVDRAKQAATTKPFGTFDPKRRFPGISNKVDLEGLDMPIPDIHTFKCKADKNVYVGGSDDKRRSNLVNAVKGVMRGCFSTDELRRMHLYFDASRPKSKGAVGECESFRFPQGKRSIIRVSKGYEREDVLVHEMVHARRYAMGEYVHDIDKEESETELESVIRMKHPREKLAGYYQFIPNVGANEKLRLNSILSDRIKATGSVKKNLKGKRAVKRTKEIYKSSEIKKVRIGGGRVGVSRRRAIRAEELDAYFLIKLPSSMKVDLHIRYKKRPSLTQIRKDMKKKYGTNIEVWEWRDGKKVKIIKNTKKKTSKQSKKRGKKK